MVLKTKKVGRHTAIHYNHGCCHVRVVLVEIPCPSTPTLFKESGFLLTQKCPGEFLYLSPLFINLHLLLVVGGLVKVKAMPLTCRTPSGNALAITTGCVPSRMPCQRPSIRKRRFIRSLSRSQDGIRF